LRGRWRGWSFAAAWSLGLALLAGAAAPSRADVVHPLSYDLLYVRAPYFGAGPGTTNSVWPDTVRPLTPDPGGQLVRLRRDGVREVLFPLDRYRSLIDTPAHTPLAAGSVADLNVSFDGKWVLFTWYHDLTRVNPQRGDEPFLSLAGADLYKLNLGTGQLVRLTRQLLTPNTGNGARFTPGDNSGNHPRIGVFNTGGTWAGGGRIVFTSNRNNFVPPKELGSGQRTLQLFAMDDDGANVEQIGHLNLAMALHPQVLLDGRIAFSSWEEHGLRDPRQFPLWVIGPDGRGWMSLSGFSEESLVHHFVTQKPGGDLVVTRYYNLNNNGFGDLVRYPLDPPGPDFGSPDATFSGSDGRIPFERTGQVWLTPFTTPDDFPLRARAGRTTSTAVPASSARLPAQVQTAAANSLIRRRRPARRAIPPGRISSPSTRRVPPITTAFTSRWARPFPAITRRSFLSPMARRSPCRPRTSRAGRRSSSPSSPRTASISNGRGRW
ncbi:MAG TPA: hypothetical protein VLV54_00075, partial [Thermoanaerobaculia bacterium]|nr:hypothetical protein [Thermoanaerobaculia bacterium]